MQKGREVPKKQNLLIVADAGVNTGFASVSHNIIKQLYKRWNIDVLAINYHGDPHDIQKYARLWNPAALMYGDLYGLSRIETLAKNLKSDVVLMINDPWVASEYRDQLKNIKAKRVLYTPVDAENIKPMYVEIINEIFDHVVAYTEFGARELIKAGLTLPYDVIPHGIDRKDFYPVSMNEARDKSGIDKDFYIVQVVDRNQIRKRIDLAVHYFAEWVHQTNKPKNVMFYYHGALKDQGWDIGQLMKYHGIQDRLILSHHDLNPSHGFPVEYMKYVYSLANVKFSFCQGEGWGLTTMESMACGVPNAVPKYSALGEWTKDSVLYMDISDIPVFTTNGINTVGRPPTKESAIRALEVLYQNKDLRESLGKKGLELVSQPQFQWSAIAQAFEAVFRKKVELDDD